MFAGIDIASERHMLARLDHTGAPIGKPIPITEDRAGYDALLKALGEVPVLIAMEATGHDWKNLFAVLAAAGHEVALLNPFVARRFQDSSLERTKTDAIDAQGLARLAFEKRPEPTHLHDEVDEGSRVVTLTATTARHTGEFMGVAAGSRALSRATIGIDRLESGRIVEHWPVTDIAGLLQQIGTAADPDHTP